MPPIEAPRMERPAKDSPQWPAYVREVRKRTRMLQKLDAESEGFTGMRKIPSYSVRDRDTSSDAQRKQAARRGEAILEFLVEASGNDAGE